MMHMLSCQEVTEIVTDYLEGRLSLMDKVRFHLHVGMCVNCRRYLRQMRETVRGLGRLTNPSIPDEVQDELMKRFRKWKR